MEDEKYEPFSLRQLKSCIDQAIKVLDDRKIDDVEVEVWVNKHMHRIISVSQFGVVPDVCLTLFDGVEMNFSEAGENK